MKVKAIEHGYYGELRRRPGDVFEMEESFYSPKDKAGKPLLGPEGQSKVCKWVEVVGQSVPVKRSVGRPKADKQVPLSKFNEA